VLRSTINKCIIYYVQVKTVTLTILRLKLGFIGGEVIQGSLTLIRPVPVFIHLILQSSAGLLQVSLQNNVIIVHRYITGQH